VHIEPQRLRVPSEVQCSGLTSRPCRETADTMKRLLFSLVLTSIMGCSESVAPHSMIDGSVSNDSGTVITSDSGSDPDSGSEDSGVDSGADTDAGSGCVGPSSPYVHLTAGNSVQLDLTGELVGNVHTVTFWARWPQTNLASIALVFGHGPTLAEDDFLVFGRGTDGRAAVQKAIGFGLESFGDTAAPPNVWHHFALLINTSSGDRTIEWYADGSLVEINEATEQNSMSDIRLTSTLGSGVHQQFDVGCDRGGDIRQVLEPIGDSQSGVLLAHRDDALPQRPH
jgi:hypothetical protein